MARIKLSYVPFGLALVCVSAAGCADSPLRQAYSHAHPTTNTVNPAEAARPIQLASYVRTESPEPNPLPSGVAASPVKIPLAPLAALSAGTLVAEVLARNPTLAQMSAAAEAAAARYPQVVSLDDPMFGAQIAPGAFGSNDLTGGYRFEVSQKYPWPGKRCLRGQSAAAEARAAGLDVEDTRLQLIESTQNAFADYYLAERGLTVSQEALGLLDEFRRNAATFFEKGRVPQQDLLQADVEIGRQKQRQLQLERMREEARARINTLMHLPPDAPLPPPPEKLPALNPLPDETALRSEALAHRPDLQALAERVAADQASLGLAHKEYYPDLEVMAAYDTIWQEKPLRPQFGVRVNLPIRLAKRDAAVQEAGARLSERIAELTKLTDEAALAVHVAYAQAAESDKTLRLYDETILPAAEQNVKSAQTYYTTGKIPFLTLIEAERNVIELRDRYYEAAAESYRRHAALKRASGGSLPLAP